MNKNLCGKCMNMLEASGYRVRRVQRGIDMKVVCENGTTASGVQTHQYKSGKPGTLAVNPDDIPLGTHVWLFDEESGEFLGEYIAEDTGGNLLRQNFVIDIFMADYDDCIEWGARRVAVWTEGKP